MGTTKSPSLVINRLFLLYYQCPRKIWLSKHYAQNDQLTKEPDFFSSWGTFSLEIAASQFEDAQNAQGDLSKTRELINAHTTCYNLCFEVEGFHLQVDLLVATELGWELHVVRKSGNLRNNMLRDGALQYFFLSEFLDITNIRVHTINTKYVRKDSLNFKGLFYEHEVTKEVLRKQNDTESTLYKIIKLLEHPEEPEMPLNMFCIKPTECRYKHHCWASVPIPSIFNIPGLPLKKKFDAYQRGIVTYQQVEKAFELNRDQAQQLQYENKGPEIVVNKAALKSFLTGLTYPLTFLDFEAIQPVVPPYPGTTPFQQIPIQYSAHILTKAGGQLQHVEFFANLKQDPRQALAVSLADKLPESGNILVYGGGFERSIMSQMSKHNPELGPALHSASARIVDLFDVFQKRIVYAQNTHGSLSFKDILPALVPDCSYDELHISDGGAASRISERLIYLKNRDEIDVIESHLKAYCKQDTFGMAKILEKLYSLL